MSSRDQSSLDDEIGYDLFTDDYVRYKFHPHTCASDIGTGVYLSSGTFTAPTLAVKKIMFNGPATIIFWNDGTKTVVKVHNIMDYDRCTGIAFACAKKLLGSSNAIKRYADNAIVPEDADNYQDISDCLRMSMAFEIANDKISSDDAEDFWFGSE